MGEEEVTGSDFAYALMLVMSVAFQLTIFYLVNWPDQDIRTYTWDIVGNTILVFTGVLIFFAFDGLTDFFVVDSFPHLKGLILFGQLLFWYSILQITSAFSSGLFHANDAKFTHINVKTMRLEECTRAEGLNERKRNAECFCSLLGHVTAFAAIHSFGYLQSATFLGNSAIGAYSVSWIALAGLFLIFAAAGMVRNFVVGCYPANKATCGEHWQEVVADIENDVCGLACSFLAFLALRFWLGGKPPPVEGTVVATPEQIPGLIPEICFAGVVFVGMGVGFLWFHFKSGLVDAEDELAYPTRLSNIGQNYSNMSVAWAALLNVNFVIRYMKWFPSCEAIPARITIAFFISYLGFFCIWVLDRVDDAMKERNIPDDWAKNIITALGLAIGFAWEQSFDTAVDDISDTLQEHFGMPKGTLVWLKFAGAWILVLCVLPAFRLHIQPIVEENNEAKARADEATSERVTKGLKKGNGIAEALLPTV